MGLGLALALAGCGGDPGELDSGESSEGSEAGGAPPSSTSATTSPGSGADGADGAGDMDGGPWNSSTTDDASSSGGVEETLFGMSDDMPLVADIPDIKRGDIVVGTLVLIEQVRPSTGRALLRGEAWFYVQDPGAEEHMGLRVVMATSDASPSEESVLDLVGRVDVDAQGWLLELESALETYPQPPVDARDVRLRALVSSTAPTLDDALVEVAGPSSLVVTRRGPVPGTVLVGPTTGSSGVTLVDLRPFAVPVDPAPGMHLSHLRGVVEIGDGRPVILPRSIDDIGIAP